MTVAALDYPRVAARIFDQPLLIEQRKLNTILRVLSPRMGFVVSQDEDFEERPEPLPPAVHAAAMAGQRAKRQEEGHYVAGSVAVIPIVGSLVQRGGYVGYSGMTSYDAIERMFDTAMSDDSVQSILLEIDSPGGEVAGAFDLAEKIFQGRGRKRIVAAVSELAASGGYLLASAASEISVPATGYVGSIGVVTAHADYSGALEQRGIAVTFIYAGDKKVDGNPYGPLSDRAHQDISADIRSLYGLFVDAVSRYRGLSPERVQDTQAGMYLGRAGIDAGLADRVNTFTNEFRNATSTAVAGSRRISTTSLPEKTMSESSKPAELTAAIETARAEGHAAGLKQGATAERQRIESIVGHADAVGREATAKHLAFKTELPAEAAVELLQSTPKVAASAGALAAAMGQQGATGVRPETDGPGSGETVVAINAHQIFQKRAQRFGTHGK